MFDLNRTKELKKKFKNRELIFGGWASIGQPQIVEAFCLINKFDFVSIDIEHGAIDYELCIRLISTIQGQNKCCLPRIDSHNRSMIKRLLDFGADGIIVPMIETYEELKSIISYIKYPPIGNRSYGVNRAHRYGNGFGNYVERWNEDSIIIIQIETVYGIENIDKLIKNPHVDGVMVGPYDLSGSMGIPGQLEHPKVKEAIQSVSRKCKDANMTTGPHLIYPDKAQLENSIKDANNLNILSSDIFILGKWAEDMNSILKQY